MPPESPSGSLAFLSTATELPIYDREGKVMDLSKEKGRSSSSTSGRPGARPASTRSRSSRSSGSTTRGASDIALYTISVDKDWKTIDDFTAKCPNTLPIYRDPDSATAKRFGTSQFPETYIINRAGRVLYRVQGGIQWGDPEVRERIRQLLAS